MGGSVLHSASGLEGVGKPVPSGYCPLTNGPLGKRRERLGRLGPQKGPQRSAVSTGDRPIQEGWAAQGWVPGCASEGGGVFFRSPPLAVVSNGGGGGDALERGTGHVGLTHTETQRGRLRTACGQRRVDSKNSQTTPATTSTSSIRQLLRAADAQPAHPATFSTAPTHQPLGSANAETPPARAPAAAADRTQRPGTTCEGKNG